MKINRPFLDIIPFSLVEIYVRCGFYCVWTRSNRVLVGKLVTLRDRPKNLVTLRNRQVVCRHVI